MLTKAQNKIEQLRHCKEYKVWRNKVIERDNSKCVLCGSFKKIIVDHIKPLALYPQLALKIENGRVLCEPCHKKTDTYGIYSKFKGDTPIHPILSGDLLCKIESLPLSIKIDKCSVGFSISYNPFKKIWLTGYKKSRINITAERETITDALNELLDILKSSK